MWRQSFLGANTEMYKGGETTGPPWQLGGGLHGFKGQIRILKGEFLPSV